MSFLPGVFTKNWQLKVLALSVAVLLWTVPRFEAQDTQVLEDIPVFVDLSDPRWALVGPPSPAQVTVTLSGPARALIAIGIDRPPLYVPMAEVLSNDTVVYLRHSWFRGSSVDGVVVVDLSPDAVNLMFEPIEERRIPLSLPLLRELPDSLSLSGPPEITPSAATVVGPESSFEGVDSIRLTAMDLSLVVGPGPFTLPVDTSGFPQLDILTREASVTLSTGVTTQREFPNQGIVLPTLASEPQLRARPASVTVFLLGAASLVDAVRPESLRVTIPTGRANLAPGQEERVPMVVEGVPEFVSYRVAPEWILLQRPVGQ